MNPIKQPREIGDRTLDTILDMRQTPYSLLEEFIAKSFYLPKEILGSKHWKIEQIQVCSAKEWREAKPFLEKQGATISYDPNSEAIINAARYLGISLRRHVLTGQTFVVVKLWYGEGVTHKVFGAGKQTRAEQ